MTILPTLCLPSARLDRYIPCVSAPTDVPSPARAVNWLGAPWRRRHVAARLPAGTDLADPPESIDEGAAKAALDQIQKRQDGQVALKTSTETRALTLAGQCMTALVAVTGAGVLEWSGAARGPLLAAALGGGACLFVAIAFALAVVRPRNFLLPGRLPDELWDELTAPDMKGPEFIARYIKSLQDGMAQNEADQRARAAALARAVRAALLAAPAAVLAAAAFHYARAAGIV